MAKDFEVEGLKDLEKNLMELGAKLAQKTLRSAGRKAMKPVLEYAKANIAVDTGDAKSALQITSGTSRNKSIIINVGGTRKRALKSQGGHELTGVNQKVIAQEYGTKRQKPAPFLRPALTNNAEKVISIFKTELRKAIDKAAK